MSIWTILIRGSADCLDRRVHCVSRGRRADSLAARVRRDLSDLAFCDGQADCLGQELVCCAREKRGPRIVAKERKTLR